MKIANEAGVDQSSISHYATRFREMTAEYGLLDVGKEYQVIDEVEALRSLSVELHKSKLTVEEAKQGHKIIVAFQKLGVGPEQHLALVEVCQKVANPGFVEAALKLSQLEAQTGMSYHQVMSGFEKAQVQLTQLQGKIAYAKTELKSANDALTKKKQELASQKAYFEKYQNEVKAKKAQMDKELSARMKQSGVEKKEVEEVASLKAELIKKGLNLPTVLKLAKEFGHGNK
jgi:septal ring factor EnvC (AmiA/AmiB activator)